MTAAPIDWTHDRQPASLLEELAHHQITADEYAAWPENVCRDIEVVDGIVVVSPAPARRHQRLVPLIWSILEEAGQPTWVAATDVDLRMADEPLHNRRPDVVVYRADLSEEAILRPSDTLLVVEVVSPGSQTTDRKTKPLVYAEAGIEHYWRVEPKNHVPVVHTYVLDETTGSYQLAATFVGTIETRLPFAVKADLTKV
jgi:Uma2 family endonuclease